MLELVLILVCILVYMYSFLYRLIAVILSLCIFLLAYSLDANLVIVGGSILTLFAIRMNKNGIKDEL
jgi:hypothetical protein